MTKLKNHIRVQTQSDTDGKLASVGRFASGLRHGLQGNLDGWDPGYIAEQRGFGFARPEAGSGGFRLLVAPANR
jgi:hypothetical protein